MNNRYLRSLFWHVLIFLLSEVFLLIFMEWGKEESSRTSAEASVMYMLIIMPVLYAIYLSMHMLLLLLTHSKKKYIFPFNPVSQAFLFDLLLLAFIGIALDNDGVLTKPVFAITVATLLFLPVEIYRTSL